MKTKKEVREQINSLFAGISHDFANNCEGTMRDIVLDLPEVKRANSVFIYQSFKNEMPTRGIIEGLMQMGKTVCVPKVSNGAMHSVLYMDNQELNSLGIPEPVDSVEHTCEVCIVPALAFDICLNRLGRGKGYYDKYLALNPNIFKIGICYSFQLLEKIPVDIHDIKMNMVTTEQRIIR